MNPLNLYDFDLPNGWAIEKLSNFVDIIMGQSPPSETYNKNREGLPFFQGKADRTYAKIPGFYSKVICTGLSFYEKPGIWTLDA